MPNRDTNQTNLLKRIQRLNTIGIALSSEKDALLLLEMVLTGARELTLADAGTLYIVLENTQGQPESLRFNLVQNDTLSIHFGGTGQPVGNMFPDLPLFLNNQQPNNAMVAAYAVLNQTTVNIKDAYHEQGFDFSGTRSFDEKTGYRSQSMIVVPLKNHENKVIAAIQLINKQIDQKTVPFTKQDEELLESLASQAAVALTNRQLIDSLHHLFNSFTKVIATAIDAKSPQTGAHCRRVPDATLMLAHAASHAKYPGLEDFEMSSDEFYALETAAWLHDCGKIVTPPHVIEKSKKLETICDRIDLVEARLEILKRDQVIEQLSDQLKALNQNPKPLSDERTHFYTNTLQFIRTANTGGEYMDDHALEKLQDLSQLYYQTLEHQKQPLLTPNELENLSVRRGTLTPAERQIMNDHMIHTINMLEQLPFPKHLEQVPEYAGGHHERMDGKGYPKGLTRDELSIPARIMGIADVFEALTAPERSYKEAMPLSQTLTIMGKMVEDNHLDPDLFNLFIDKKVYLAYAKKHLKNEQIDTFNLQDLPGYTGLQAKEAADEN